MAVTYLLDTDWVVDYLQEKLSAVEMIQRLHPDGLGISIMTLAELELGVSGSRNPEAARQGLDDFLTSVEVFGLSEDICKVFSEWSITLQRRDRNWIISMCLSQPRRFTTS